MDFKRHRLTSERMIEVEQKPVTAILPDNAGIRRLTVGRWELHDVAYLISCVEIPQFMQQGQLHPLQHVRVALPESLPWRKLEGRTGALGQAEQARLHGRRKFAGTHGQRGRLVGKGVDQIGAIRPRQAVMQGEKRALLNVGQFSSFDRLDRILGAWTLRADKSIFSCCPVVTIATLRTCTLVAGSALSAPLPVFHELPDVLKNLPPEVRPREKLLAQGPAALANAELLALLLRTGFKGTSVLQLAQQLLDSFHGLAGLLRASPDELKRIKGLGPAKRAEVSAVLELARRSLAQSLKQRPVFESPSQVKDYLRLHLGACQHEVFTVLFLDAQNCLLRMEDMFRGTLTQTSVYPREIVKRSLELQAAAVVLAHNHPSGCAEPSRADEFLTQSLRSALALVDVRVLDHLVVGCNEVVSFAERGLI